jgi:hypothetical protein
VMRRHGKDKIDRAESFPAQAGLRVVIHDDADRQIRLAAAQRFQRAGQGFGAQL